MCFHPHGLVSLMKHVFRIAHLSDVHLGPLKGLNWRSLTNKRILGYINWHRGRKNVHLRDKIDLLMQDIELHEPDHVAVTGDLVNLGLPEEFIAAMEWLEAIGPPDYVSVVPGNHDAYVKLRNDPGFKRWMPYMTSNEGGRAFEDSEEAFPYVKRFGDVALIGFSSAVPTPPFIASGRLGPEQIAPAGGIFEKLGREGLCRIVLMHHPPMTSRSNWYRGLSDAKAFGKIVKSHGAELILHGHWHKQTMNSMDVANGHVPIIGVPSASSGQVGHKPLARYNLFDFYRQGDQWTAHMTGRGLSSLEGPVQTIETHEIELAFHKERESEMIDG